MMSIKKIGVLAQLGFLWLLFSLGYHNCLGAQGNPGSSSELNWSSEETYHFIRELEEMRKDEILIDQLLRIDTALLKAESAYRQRFFLLAGWLGRSEALNAVPYEYRRSVRDQNAYDLAMIRLGEERRIRRLNRLLQSVSVNDDFVFDLAADLLYTRRREVFDFFLDQILLDQQNCSPADAHSSGRINCAYRLLELIAPHIEDFPLQVGTSGDLEVADYVAALGLARLWINEHRMDYRIITATY